MTGRALAILATFAPDRRELSLAEISRLTGLAASTAHRLLVELCEWGALERRPDLRYRIGRRLCELAPLAPPRDGTALDPPLAGSHGRRTRAPLMEISPPEFIEELIRPQTIKRFGEPEEVGFAVAYLCSDRAAFITGVALPIDGGYMTGA